MKKIELRVIMKNDKCIGSVADDHTKKIVWDQKTSTISVYKSSDRDIKPHVTYSQGYIDYWYYI